MFCVPGFTGSLGVHFLEWLESLWLGTLRYVASDLYSLGHATPILWLVTLTRSSRGRYHYRNSDFFLLLGVIKSRGIQPGAVCSLSDRLSHPCSPVLLCVFGPADGGAGCAWVRLNGCFETVGISGEINWWWKCPASGTRKGNEHLWELNLCAWCELKAW